MADAWCVELDLDLDETLTRLGELIISGNAT
jgi:hypothetical protein